ncbi:MAG TPA: glycosyltransferase family 39 protein, partial [Solirubrobacteraceae bacterium]|nr:glycosyltransferase family 39 protein [Solirubrobacteraceae bacterium]
NPPAFTYLLHYLFGIWYGGGAGVVHAFALHPDELYTLARVVAAVLGVAALWLLYLTGARLFGRGVGLLAAAIEAVAFLPVFYAHLALNDVPTLAPLTLSLLGTAGVVRKGRRRDYLLAGVGLGLACATKYTAGIAIVPLAAAVAARYLDREPSGGGPVLAGLLLAGAAALLAFLLANPYAVLDYSSFHGELVHQSTLSAEAQGKLGAPGHGGIPYYLWSLTWGLGWAPALAALGGALTVWRSSPRLGWLLVPAPLLFLLAMGLQGRYFGRWLMPILPITCLLAAFFAVRMLDVAARLAAPRRRGRAAVAALLVAALLAQGVLYSVHAGLVLSRADTRSLTRAWMLAHVPAGARIVVEPVAPDEWAREVRPGTSTAANPDRWKKYPSLFARISASGVLEQTAARKVGIENYERTLAPALIGYYLANGYCWVISGSTQSGRAFADPGAVPLAIAYYRALAQQGEVVHRSSPYGRGQGPVAFGFDWSFDYYPLAYRRPGPEMTVYRLHGGRCGR